jgi:hypothetical protein
MEFSYPNLSILLLKISPSPFLQILFVIPQEAFERLGILLASSIN